jgi:hypothetical protein
MDGNDISCLDHFLLVTKKSLILFAGFKLTFLKVFAIIMLEFFFYERKSFMGFFISFTLLTIRLVCVYGN